MRVVHRTDGESLRLAGRQAIINAGLQACLAALLTSSAIAQGPAAAGAPRPSHSSVTPTVAAQPRSSPISLDGRLDEPAWSGPAVARDFIQYDPDEGKPATQQTEVRVVFDDDALYIAARMYDSLGAAGVRSRLRRRDQAGDGDYLQFVLDTFHDHTGRTSFMINPSGVKQDAGQASPYLDPSWDPVWEVATEIDSLGWTAELRIPFSQLRFPRTAEQTWGMQIWRYVERINETSMWSPWGKEDVGSPARFGHLDGLRIEGPKLGIEVLPYVVGRAEYVRPVPRGTPFQEPREFGWRVGGDVKALLGSTLTLDATFNPDFGQVEVDPAVVNLSAFETFFEEKRPFFVEGSGLFGFGGLSCYFCSNVQSMSLFYSRRVGRFPQGFVTDDADYVDIPENTTILGAAKITGRTAGGYQIGLLDAVTSREHARAAFGDERFEREVEPLSNYFVGRVKRNMRNGNLTLGAIGTSVVRRFEEDALAELLPQHAEAAGIDWNANWKERTYNFAGNLALSQVSGDPDAILRLQQSSARYFIRPDRKHGGNGFLTDSLDETLGTMRGLGGYARLAKQAGSWLWESSVNFRTPGFEVNDLAFLTRADYVWMNANVFRQWTQPTRRYRSMNAIAGAQQQYNFDGDLTDRQLHGYFNLQFPNYWSANTFMIVRPETYEDRLTRGGPVVRRAANWTAFLNLYTDNRRAVVVSTSPVYGRNAEGATGYDINLNLQVKPGSNLQMSVRPAFTRSAASAQFVRRFTDPSATHFFGQRVVFADLRQNTFSFETRVNATFTPTLTLEVFAQPFVSSAEYSGFKEFDAPRSVDKTRFDATQLRPILSAAGRDSAYVLDPDRDPATADFEFRNPDFNFRSLRGNAVLRWEYRPGSTLFLVWQQQRAAQRPFADFDIFGDAGAIFRERPDNIFLVKMTYWFGR